MPPDTGISLVLAAVAVVLSDSGSRWFLFGAQAVNVWGVPRLTNDVDVTVEVPPDRSEEYVSRFERGGFSPRFAFDQEFIRKARVIPLTHTETGRPLDVVLAGPGLEEEFLRRARRMTIAQVEVPVISPEDLLIVKILAARPKDIEDVRGILRVRAETLDLDRVRRVLGELEQALGQSDLVPAFDRLRAESR